MNFLESKFMQVKANSRLKRQKTILGSILPQHTYFIFQDPDKK